MNFLEIHAYVHTNTHTYEKNIVTTLCPPGSIIQLELNEVIFVFETLFGREILMKSTDMSQKI